MDQQSARRGLILVAVAFAVIIGVGGRGALLRPPAPPPQWGHPCEESSKGYCLVENAPIKESGIDRLRAPRSTPPWPHSAWPAQFLIDCAVGSNSCASSSGERPACTARPSGA
jgi:hypothetical protein